MYGGTALQVSDWLVGGRGVARPALDGVMGFNSSIHWSVHENSFVDRYRKFSGVINITKVLFDYVPASFVKAR